MKKVNYNYFFTLFFSYIMSYYNITQPADYRHKCVDDKNLYILNSSVRRAEAHTHTIILSVWRGGVGRGDTHNWDK